MTQYCFREMQLAETRSMIRYFLEADLEFLDGMGVNPAKLPSEEDWFELLQDDYARPLQQRQYSQETRIHADRLGRARRRRDSLGVGVALRWTRPPFVIYRCSVTSDSL